MALSDHATNLDALLTTGAVKPLWVDILGAVVWLACVVGWTAIVVAIGVLIQ